MAGRANNFTLVLVDQLGQQVNGRATDVEAAMRFYPPDAMYPSGADNHSFIQSVVDSASGSLTVVWNGTVATPADNSLVYELNVSLANSDKVKGDHIMCC